MSESTRVRTATAKIAATSSGSKNRATSISVLPAPATATARYGIFNNQEDGSGMSIPEDELAAPDRKDGPDIERLKALLKFVNPHCPVPTRDLVIAAIHQMTGGSSSGMDIAARWCSQREDCPPTPILQAKWRTNVAIAEQLNGFEELCKIVTDDGFDPSEILGSDDSKLEPTETSSAVPELNQPRAEETTSTALSRYSLKGHRDELERTAVDQVHVLGPLALLNQLTGIYGPPGVGKSLITLALLVDAIKKGNIPADKIYYLDFDSDPNALLEKHSIAETYGFNLLSDGYRDFSSKAFALSIERMTEDGTAHGIVVVLDTLKKFVSIMDKTRSSSYAQRLRRFSKAGGTVIAIGHVNKHRTADNKPIYAGTTDFIEDFDCSYLMFELGIDADSQTRTVTFENIKRRGDVAQKVNFRYSIRDGLSYQELFESVCLVTEGDASDVARRATLKRDHKLIVAIAESIRRGIVLKSDLVAAAYKCTGASRRMAQDVLDRYCGSEAQLSLWTYTVGERGGKSYRLTPDGELFLTRG